MSSCFGDDLDEESNKDFTLGIYVGGTLFWAVIETTTCSTWVNRYQFLSIGDVVIPET